MNKSKQLGLMGLTVMVSLLGSVVVYAAEVPVDLLQKRAAFALGVQADQVSIADIDTSEPYRTQFSALVSGKTLTCYVTASGSVVSDAVCSGAGFKTCDALSAAAGKC